MHPNLPHSFPRVNCPSLFRTFVFVRSAISPPSLGRLFVSHRANTILVTVHSILFYLISIKGQRCIGHLLLLFPPSPCWCTVLFHFQLALSFFYPFRHFPPSFAKLYALSALDHVSSSLESTESFLSSCSLCTCQALFASEQTTRLPLVKKDRKSDLCSIRLLDRYTGNFMEVRIRPRFQNLSGTEFRE